MCGILGFNWEDEKKVRSLAELLNHRGPEQEGFHVKDGVSIGHKRLKIIDLSEKGRQPMYNEDGSVCVSFNGEIFNFPEIKESLEKQGHVFISHTDTEVLVHGYEQWGVDMLEHLNGQFAFCIFDKKQNFFFLARDRFGIKPLFYYCDDKRFIFGSELKVFLKSDIEKKIDQYAMDYYMLFGNTPFDRSILEGVKKLPPANFMIYDLSSKKIKEFSRYWTLSFAEQLDCSQEEIEKQIVERLDRAVKMQMVSDVPLGAFLSGGVDSSILVAIMSKYVKDLHTFSIRFDRPDFNESHYAKIISDKFGTRHFEIDFNADNVRELITRLPYYYDDPFGDPSMIPTCLVSQVARQHVTVSLSGTGGDELFGGYGHYNDYVLLRTLNNLPVPAKRLLDYSTVLANLLFRKEKFNKLRGFLGKKEDPATLYMRLFSYMFRTKEESSDKLLPYKDHIATHFIYPNDINNAMNCDLNEYLSDDLLVKEDRASMAVTLEARVPFLDHTLAEFAAKIPPRLRIRFGQKKYILKSAFRNILPHEILYRPKKGFGVPLIHYFRNELRDFAYNEIFGFDGLNYFDKDTLKIYWDRHQSKKHDYYRIFWSIMMFNMWFKKWMT
jgi:asparagine synthase (glutamine-hydrolysing)